MITDEQALIIATAEPSLLLEWSRSVGEHMLTLGEWMRRRQRRAG